MNEADEVLKRIDYRRFYQNHIPGLNVDGRKEVQTLCPLHSEKEPSFSVNLETGLFNCFSNCGGGNAFQFIERLYNIPFKEALEKIKADEGITVTKTSPKARKEPPKTAPAAPQRSAYLNVDQIGNIHRQLITNEKRLKVFQDKYGLDLSTIEKYLIGYQDERFVIPIQIEPGKWNIKEHKGLQLKGAKASIYPAAVLKERLLHVLICEGEFKALLLNQHGFPAVSGSGGAGTWKREWNALFAGLNVILAFDADEPGRQGPRKWPNSSAGL